MQSTSHILMIRPVKFEFNVQTAVNNAFQVALNNGDVHAAALKEFDNFVEKLRSKGIHVSVIDDSTEPHTPDSIFPNNWISFNSNGSVVLYPMYAPNRRLERKPGVLEFVKNRFRVSEIIDYTSYENEGRYLEGTGSMVLDHEYSLAYACLSPRTDVSLLEQFCSSTGYKAITFEALDKKGRQIYHTNVMMCVADRYVVICMESIRNPSDRQLLEDTIRSCGKERIDIDLDQMNRFAGNMLQVQNDQGKKFLVMSSQAYESLTEDQRSRLQEFNEIVHSPLHTIESNGGGSARCMMAEIFLEPKKDSSSAGSQ
jgi:hypothetical protein